MEDCIHHWIIGLTHNDDKARYTHERCIKCLGERYLIIDKNTRAEHYTEIQFPIMVKAEREKEEIMSEPGIKRGSHNRRLNREKQREYENRKEEILSALNTPGISTREAARKLDIPIISLWTLKSRWQGKQKNYLRKHNDSDKDNNVEIIEQMLQYDDIKEARLFWAGVKAAKGIQ